MQTKLTLRLERRLIERAKDWARSHDVSLSEAVSGFFAQLPESGREQTLHPWTQRLVGAARGKTKSAPSDDALEREYFAHLDAKHR